MKLTRQFESECDNWYNNLLLHTKEAFMATAKGLVALVQKNEDAFEYLISKHGMTAGQLNTWYMVGIGKYSLGALTSSCPFYRKATSLPPEIQKRIPEKIPVVVSEKGTFKTVLMEKEEMTNAQVQRALNSKGVVPSIEQEKILVLQMNMPERPRYSFEGDGITFYEKVHLSWGELQDLLKTATSPDKLRAIQTSIQANQIQ